ncbi:MAG: acyl-CoA dehydrogenase family protein [Acidimicrobiia bacterium]|jgi:alkylation response protein AidB-like acyl-CoA dehydrogenase
MTVHDPLAAARALRPLVEEHAHSDATPVDHVVVEAFREAGLYGALAPKELGGLELSLEENLDIVEEIAYADGSTGWTYMACATTSAFFGAWCGDEFVREAFADGVPLMAGQLAPNGQATKVVGGYVVNGNFQFGSGIDHASLVGMGFIVTDGDNPPEYRMGVVPKDAVTLTGNWDVMGLRATASYDYRVVDVFVPEAASFSYAAVGSLAPLHRRGGTVYDLGILILTCVGHAAWAMGLARRALDEVRTLAPTKHRMASASVLAESERFLHDYARLEQRARASAARTREVFRQAEEAGELGTVTAELSAEVRSTNAFVTEEAAEVIRGCYLLAGTSGLRSGPIERAFRDIHAGTQHAMVNPQHHIEWARNLLA